MKCLCNELTELIGEEALKYIDEHLHLVPFPGKTANDYYKCPLTGITWYTDYDISGSMRLVNGLVRKANKSMNCRCDQIDELWDDEASEYIDGHLKVLYVDDEKWQIFYLCPVTNKVWIEERPSSRLHGGGPSRLRQMNITGTEFDRNKRND